MEIWDRIVNVADTVTAIAAVVAVVLATWLGLKAIRVAREDNDQSQQQFLYDQVDLVLQSAVALTSSATDVSTSTGDDHGADARAMERCSEEFDTRLRVLTALGFTTAQDSLDEVRQFATMLAEVARANHRLTRDGRAVLVPTIVDGDSGDYLLDDLSKRVFGHDSYIETHPGTGEEVEMPGADGKENIDAEIDPFRHDPAYAAELRVLTAQSGWEPTVYQSLRLVLPWIRVSLGWSYVQFVNDDGTPGQLMENDWGAWFDESTLEMHEPDHPAAAAAAWLDAWPKRYWVFEPNFTHDKASPEQIARQLLSDLRAAFIDRLVALVQRTQEGIAEQRVRS